MMDKDKSKEEEAKEKGFLVVVMGTDRRQIGAFWTLRIPRIGEHVLLTRGEDEMAFRVNEVAFLRQSDAFQASIIVQEGPLAVRDFLPEEHLYWPEQE